MTKESKTHKLSSRPRSQTSLPSSGRYRKKGNNMQRRRLVAFASLLITLAGCKVGPAPPTEADGRQVWTNINNRSGMDSVLQLVDFKKTDGQMAEVNGVKIYTLFFEVHERHLIKMGNWKPGDIETARSNYGFQRTEKGWQGPDGTLFKD